MIDESNDRGTTCICIVVLLKEAEAKDVHVRISSPRIENPCYYGIDMSTRKELIAANHSTAEIEEIMGADSVAFLSAEGMKHASVKDKTIHQGVCNACFTGDYSVRVDETAFQIGGSGAMTAPRTD